MQHLATSFPVNLKDIIKALCMSAGLIFVFQFFLGFTGAHIYLEQFGHESMVTAVIYMLQSFAMLFPVYYYALRRHRLRLADLGFKKVGAKQTVLLILGSFGILFAVNFLVALFMLNTGIEIPGFGMQEEHISMFGTGAFDLVIAVLVLGVVAPIIEEFIFRGFILQGLLKYMNPWMASFLSATMFGVIHFEFSSLAILIFLGMILNRMYLKSGSIIPGIIFHMINNVLAFGLEFLR